MRIFFLLTDAFKSQSRHSYCERSWRSNAMRVWRSQVRALRSSKSCHPAYLFDSIAECGRTHEGQPRGSQGARRSVKFHSPRRGIPIIRPLTAADLGSKMKLINIKTDKHNSHPAAKASRETRSDDRKVHAVAKTFTTIHTQIRSRILDKIEINNTSRP